jgi:hypothetical protein
MRMFSVIAGAADYWGRHTKNPGGLSVKIRPGASPGQIFAATPFYFFVGVPAKTPAASATSRKLAISVF